MPQPWHRNEQRESDGTMKALRVHDYAGPLREEVVGDPQAASGQVVVRVVATSFNPIDPKRASGRMREIMPLTFPWIPGGDVSGVVESVGAQVRDLAQGDEVFGYSMAGGAYAERIAVDGAALAVKPRTIQHEIAAAIGVVGQTATQTVSTGRLRSGQTLLVHGGSGGVGSLAIQLAHALGVSVIATARASQASALRGLGVDRVIDYTTERFEDSSGAIDVVFDFVGGDVQQRSISLLKPGGILVATSQPPDPKRCALRGVEGSCCRRISSHGLAAFADKIVSGKIRPLIERVESLWQPATLWDERPAGATLGKTIFMLNGI